MISDASHFGINGFNTDYYTTFVCVLTGGHKARSLRPQTFPAARLTAAILSAGGLPVSKAFHNSRPVHGDIGADMSHQQYLMPF
jgi:hypothetical protein